METVWNCSSTDKRKSSKVFYCTIGKKYVLYNLTVNENGRRVSSDSKAFPLNNLELAKQEAIKYCELVRSIKEVEAAWELTAALSISK